MRQALSESVDSRLNPLIRDPSLHHQKEVPPNVVLIAQKSLGNKNIGLVYKL